jgi:hypothetical protein
MTEDVKPWKCQNGHVLGQVQRNASGIRQLLLYRYAVNLAETNSSPDGGGQASGEEPGEVEVIAVVEGYVADVRCSECGSIRTWVPGQEALDRLLERVMQRNRLLKV